jgi:hypothetical protein
MWLFLKIILGVFQACLEGAGSCGRGYLSVLLFTQHISNLTDGDSVIFQYSYLY